MSKKTSTARRLAAVSPPETPNARIILWEEIPEVQRQDPEYWVHKFLFGDNRKTGPHMYHDMGVVSLAQLRALAKVRKAEDGCRPLPPDFLMKEVPDAKTLFMFRHAIKHGLLKDTTMVARWLGTMNRMARFEEFGLPPLELVVFHVETHIEEVNTLFVDRGFRPAGYGSSGSAKMLGPDRENPEAIVYLGTTAIQETLRLIADLHRRRVPMLGICFGMHLMAYEVFGELVDYLRVPEGCNAQVHPPEKHRGEVLHRVRRGQRFMNIGLNRLREMQPSRSKGIKFAVRRKAATRERPRYWHPPDPLMREVNGTITSVVHSQTLEVDNVLRNGRIAPRFIKAVATRIFRDTRAQGRQPDVEQRIIMALRKGLTYMVQPHPEMYWPYLIFVSFLKAYDKIFKAEGQYMEFWRQELEHLRPGDDYSAAERMGYNFVRWALVMTFIGQAVKDGRITTTQARELVKRVRFHRGR